MLGAAMVGELKEGSMSGFDQYGNKRYSVRGWWVAAGVFALAFVAFSLFRWVL